LKQPSRKQTMTGGVLVFLLILGAYVVGFVGWGSPKQSAGSGETTMWNAGADSCSIPAGSTTCVKLTTWPTPLAATPCSGCEEVSRFTVTGSQLDQTVISTSTTVFFANGNTLTGDTWPNMPAAQTELFGDANGDHWRTVDWTSASQVAFAVNCITGSSSATAILQLQWSTDSGASWNNIANSINIQAANCPNGSILAGSPTSYASIPASAQTVNVALRVIGQNGNGLGDNPQFTTMYAITQYSYTVSFQATASLSSFTATTITVVAGITVKQPSPTGINWKMSAWICIAGGSGPC